MRNLFFIVEGPDNVGKSTLIENLKNAYNYYTFHVLHYSNVKQKDNEQTIKYNTKLYDQMFRIMADQVQHNHTGVICDRSHLGEMVYGPIYRGYDGKYVLDIEKKIHNNWDLSKSLVLITLVDIPDNIVARDDGLSFSTDLDIKKKEIELFEQTHDLSTIKNKILINVQNNDANRVLDMCTTFVQEKFPGVWL